MSPSWTDIVQAISSASAVAIAVVGFLVIRYQIKQVEKGIQGETHSGLYQHNFEVMKFIAEHPNVRPYFYDGKELQKGDENYALIITTAGMMAALFEHVALQRPNLPDHVWKTWVQHIKETYSKSSALSQYYKDHEGWYSSEFRELLEIPETGAIANR